MWLGEAAASPNPRGSTSMYFGSGLGTQRTRRTSLVAIIPEPANNTSAAADTKGIRDMPPVSGKAVATDDVTSSSPALEVAVAVAVGVALEVAEGLAITSS